MPFYRDRPFVAVCMVGFLLSMPVFTQQNPVVVQPGAPGQPTKTLPSSTRPTLPPPSPADVQFMQHMIVHHAQAVEMTALIASHSESKELRTLGARISRSQTDEIRFMERWLEGRRRWKSEVGGHNAEARSQRSEVGGQKSPHGSHGTQGHEENLMAMLSHEMLMPGMLSAKQMDELRKAKGKEFDRLFLSGMIQHHNGALTMVKDLFDTAGAGQDAELFNFATDVDSGQRAEIKIMQTMLGEKP